MEKVGGLSIGHGVVNRQHKPSAAAEQQRFYLVIRKAYNDWKNINNSFFSNP